MLKRIGVERLFLFLAMACSFFVVAEASIAKSIAAACFVERYSASSFPYVWMAVVPAGFLIVWLYNNLITRIGCLKTFLTFFILAININLFSAFFYGKFYYWFFFLYLWKEVYILLLFHQLWAVINATLVSKQGKGVFVLLFAAGGIGSTLGSYFLAQMTPLLGTYKGILLTLPFSFSVGACFTLLLYLRERMDKVEPIHFAVQGFFDFFESARLIRASLTLQFILFLVVSMQVSSTLLDYFFQNSLFELLPNNMDARTVHSSSFFFYVNFINLLIQVGLSSFLLRKAGIALIHLFIPSSLLMMLAFCFFSPTFSSISFMYGSIKVLDYSIFGVSKELLYLGLGMDEKFRAKATIDVFGYRSSKALASIAILFFPFTSLYIVLFSVLSLWSALVYYYFFFLKRDRPELQEKASLD